MNKGGKVKGSLRNSPRVSVDEAGKVTGQWHRWRRALAAKTNNLYLIE